jgi:serine/threonine protein kinase
MTPERWQQVKEVLDLALQMDAADRPAFVGRACLTDQSLQREVESLLASGAGVAENFLKSAPPDHGWIAKGTRFGSYEILNLIGAGGMGEVYRARDPRLRRDVAVKVLPSVVSSDPDRLRRFEQEAQAAAALNHPKPLFRLQLPTNVGSYDVTRDGKRFLVNYRTLKQQTEPLTVATNWLLQLQAEPRNVSPKNGVGHR